MDYIVNVPEMGDIVVEQTNIEEARKGSERRLLAYYVAFMAPQIKSKLDDKDKMKLLIKIAGALSEEDIKEKMAMLSDEKKKEGIIAILQELVDAYEDEDLDQYVDITVNGNVFTYTKDLNIAPYMELFESIGKDTHGNKWRVEIDNEGKVVLHE